MNSCDYIRDCKEKKKPPSALQSPLSRLLHRNASDKHPHHKSHEVLTDRTDTVLSSPFKCDLRANKSIDRKDQSKRNSRSEDNLMGMAQKVPPSASGQILLTQDFFTVSLVGRKGVASGLSTLF